jgi:hypothetical protein
VIFIGYLSNLLWQAPVFTLFTGFPVCLILFYKFRIKDDKNDIALTEILFVTMFLMYVIVSSLVSIFVPEYHTYYYLAVVPVIILAIGIRFNNSSGLGKPGYNVFMLLAVLSLIFNIYIFRTELVKNKIVASKLIGYVLENSDQNDTVVVNNTDILGLTGQIYFSRRISMTPYMHDIVELFNKISDIGIKKCLVICDDYKLKKNVQNYCDRNSRCNIMGVFYIDEKYVLNIRMNNRY